jgi:hypothetical protein
MARTKDTPGVVHYYQALHKIFSLESEVLTSVLPHSGERGRNDEERLRTFLLRVLPRRFSVGTGFIVCSERAVPMSSQTDVVIFDEIYNSPLHREHAAHVYPVEMVYGTVEVTATLTPKKLLKACRDIQRVRQLGLHQYYDQYGSVAPNPERPHETVAATVETHRKTPPRAFLFAYEQKGWKDIDALEANVRAGVKETGAHIHGLAVLRPGWHLAQRAYKDPAKFDREEGNTLLNFLRGMLRSIQSRPIVHPAAISRYMTEAKGPDASDVVTRKPARSKVSRSAGR